MDNNNNDDSSSPSITIKTSTSQAKIALHGAHVYSWTVLGHEKLFLSSKSDLRGPAPIRGGIPICFPIFGSPPAGEEEYKELKSHGFARNLTWSLDGIEESEEESSARFSLSSENPEVKKIFKPDFLVNMTVKIREKRLTTSLKVTNTSEEGSKSLRMQALFHNYIKIPAESGVLEVKIGEMKGLNYTDKVAGGIVGRETREVVDLVAGEVDRVYHAVPDAFLVHLGNKNRVAFRTLGLPDLTIWNPHQVKSDALVDMHKDGWKNFVCVEPGQTSFVSILPNHHWFGSQELSALF